MLSQKSKYALRALLILARAEDDGLVLIADIAKRGRIPKKFLEQILLTLKNLGLLQSKKGRGGGYSLGRPADEITFGSVIRALDGPLAPIPCVSLTAHRKCDDCEDEATCEIRKVMWGVREETARILDGTTLADALLASTRVKRKGAAPTRTARTARTSRSGKA